MRSTRRPVLALIALTLVATACGQKPGVHVELAGGDQAAPSAAQPAPVFTDGDGDGVDDSSGLAADAFAEQATATAAASPTSAALAQPTGAASPPGEQPPAPQAPQPQAAPQQPQQPQQPAAGDSTGVSANEIVIGVHAPLSGAAPLPQSSFNSGSQQYWNHIGQVAGRRVRVVVVNDEYNPSRAKSVCDQLIQQEKVFILVGGAGADQIAACARTAAQQGVPYLSAGVDEGVLRQLPNYFALSLSYVQQAPLLRQYIARHARPSNNRVAILRDASPSFNNVVARVTQELAGAGFEVLERRAANPTSDAQWLAANQIQTAFPIMSPSYFLQIFGAPGGQIDNWVGIGITMGLNTVASVGCGASPAFDGSMFFSPFPGLNQIDRLDPRFRQAGGRDDIELALWGLNATIHQAFARMGDNLTREAFVQAMTAAPISSNVYPELRHSPQDHFGAQSVHVLVADCGAGQFVTPDGGLFVTGF